VQFEIGERCFLGVAEVADLETFRFAEEAPLANYGGNLSLSAILMAENLCFANRCADVGPNHFAWVVDISYAEIHPRDVRLQVRDYGHRQFSLAFMLGRLYLETSNLCEMVEEQLRSFSRRVLPNPNSGLRAKHGGARIDRGGPTRHQFRGGFSKDP
jgi:hypothetical protein